VCMNTAALLRHALARPAVAFAWQQVSQVKPTLPLLLSHSAATRSAISGTTLSDGRCCVQANLPSHVMHSDDSALTCQRSQRA
jgi:hypothetical protein